MTVWATTDLHGYYKLYEKIKYFIQPEDKVIFLGDAGDRGPHSFKLINAILDDKQFIYLKGNHEELLYQAGLNYVGIKSYPYAYYDLIHNGGHRTWNDFLNINKSKQKILLKKLKNLPSKYIYKNKEGNELYLCHAGFTPGKISYGNELWNRRHLFDEIPKDIQKNLIIVHGHTPVQACYQKEVKPMFYFGGHKINLDMGTATSKKCCLLNLDTLEYQMFKLEEDEIYG